jgi:hypothetical protein
MKPLTTKRFELGSLYPNLVGAYADKTGRPANELFLIRKTLGKTSKVDRDDRSVIARISTSEIDRDLEVLAPEGMDDRNYRANPVVLWSHSYSNPDHVIGKNAWIVKGEDGTSLIAKTHFAKHKFADQVYQGYTEDIGDGIGPLLKMWSVGFIPLEWEDNPKNMKGVQRLYSAWEIIEYSAVPIGSNRNALTLRSKGFDPDFLNQIEIEPDEDREIVLDSPDARAYIEGRLKANVDQIFEKARESFHKNDPVTNGVTEYVKGDAFRKHVETEIKKELGRLKGRILTDREIESFSIADILNPKKHIKD